MSVATFLLGGRLCKAAGAWLPSGRTVDIPEGAGGTCALAWLCVLHQLLCPPHQYHRRQHSPVRPQTLHPIDGTSVWHLYRTESRPDSPALGRRMLQKSNCLCLAEIETMLVGLCPLSS